MLDTIQKDPQPLNHNMIPEIEKEEYERLTSRWKTTRGIEIAKNIGHAIAIGQIWQPIAREIDYSDEVDDQLDLRGFDFSNKILNSVNFSRANLHHCTFENAKLTKCDFSDCEMFYSNFTNVQAEECSFSNGLMCRLNAHEATFDSCVFSDTNLLGANLTKTVFRQCKMKNSLIFMAQTEDIAFINTDQSQIRLTGTTPIFD